MSTGVATGPPDTRTVAAVHHGASDGPERRMGRSIGRLLALAAERRGYFTTLQAREAGISRQMLSHYADLGYAERLRRGIYRLAAHPRHTHEAILVATLWAGPGAAASHASALIVLGALDEGAGPVHVTTGPGFHGRRRDTVVHRGAIGATQCTVVDGIVVTGPERTVRDLAAARHVITVGPLLEAMLDRQVLGVEELRALSMRWPAVAAAAASTLLRRARPVRAGSS